MMTALAVLGGLILALGVAAVCAAILGGRSDCYTQEELDERGRAS